MRCFASGAYSRSRNSTTRMPGVLHQDDVRNAQLGRARVHIAHLRRGQNLHARTSASTCSSLRKIRGLAHHDQKIAAFNLGVRPAD